MTPLANQPARPNLTTPGCSAANWPTGLPCAGCTADIAPPSGMSTAGHPFPVEGVRKLDGLTRVAEHLVLASTGGAHHRLERLAGHLLVDSFVSSAHRGEIEACRLFATVCRVDLIDVFDRAHHLVDVVTDESGDTIDDDLGDGAPP